MGVKRQVLTIKGKVQGVYFREFAKQNANKLGIVGYAKNVKDYLEIDCQGEEMKLADFVRICKRGPIFANVLSVESQEKDPDEDYEYFDVR